MSDPNPMNLMPKDDRPRFTFTIPPEERAYPTDPTRVTLVPLRVSEEMEAEKVAMAGPRDADMETLRGLELVRRAVVAIDGKPVNWSSPLGPEWLERCSPQVRSRVRQAYNRVHMPREKNDAGFFDSMVVESGASG
jgi:hypothetical protein